MLACFVQCYRKLRHRETKGLPPTGPRSRRSLALYLYTERRPQLGECTLSRLSFPGSVRVEMRVLTIPSFTQPPIDPTPHRRAGPPAEHEAKPTNVVDGKQADQRCSHVCSSHTAQALRRIEQLSVGTANSLDQARQRPIRCVRSFAERGNVDPHGIGDGNQHLCGIGRGHLEEATHLEVAASATEQHVG